MYDFAATGIWRAIALKNNKAVLTTQDNFPGTMLIPGVIGMGLKDAVYLMEKLGLTVRVNGKGRVMSQSLAVGANFKKGQTVTLLLN